MGGTSFFIRLCVVLGVLAMAVGSQVSHSGRPNTSSEDEKPETCSCQADVSVKATGCNATTFRRISTELEDTRRQLQAAVSTDKTAILSELEETRHQVEKLQASVSSSQDSVSSELRDMRQQLGELKTSVSAVVDILKDTTLIREALPNNAAGSTKHTSATNNGTTPTDESRVATERSATTAAVTIATDCSEILASGLKESGVYTVQPLDSGEAFQVYCDMETDGGGWTVFQRRQDGSVDFYLDFASYSRGFGDLEREFWLGNDNLHRLTAQGEYGLRIDLSDFEGNTKYAIYESFSIAGVKDNYMLEVQGYSGTAGDSLSGLHDKQPFSTRDRDNDGYSGNCAVMFHGAWWFNACHSSNLNGEYLGGHTAEFSRGVNWQKWTGFLYSLRTTEMKIRVKQ